jgi:hypothetical protein
MILTIALAAAMTAAAPYPEETTLGELCALVSSQTGKNYLPSERIRDRVLYLHADKTEPAELLEGLRNALGIEVEETRREGYFRVTAPDREPAYAKLIDGANELLAWSLRTAPAPAGMSQTDRSRILADVIRDIDPRSDPEAFARAAALSRASRLLESLAGVVLAKTLLQTPQVRARAPFLSWTRKADIVWIKDPETLEDLRESTSYSSFAVLPTFNHNRYGHRFVMWALVGLSPGKAKTLGASSTGFERPAPTKWSGIDFPGTALEAPSTLRTQPMVGFWLWPHIARQVGLRTAVWDPMEPAGWASLPTRITFADLRERYVGSSVEVSKKGAWLCVKEAAFPLRNLIPWSDVLPKLRAIEGANSSLTQMAKFANELSAEQAEVLAGAEYELPLVSPRRRLLTAGAFLLRALPATAISQLEAGGTTYSCDVSTMDAKGQSAVRSFLGTAPVWRSFPMFLLDESASQIAPQCTLRVRYERGKSKVTGLEITLIPPPERNDLEPWTFAWD